MLPGRSLIQTLKTHFRFSKQEVVALLIGIVAIGFMVSFNKWGDETFDATAGLYNFAIAIVVSAIVVLVSQSATRISGLNVGIKTEYRLWIYGLLIGLMLCIVTRGHLWFLAPGGIIVHHMAGHRIGYFRYWLMHRQRAGTAFAGPFACIILGLVFKIIETLGVEAFFVSLGIKVAIWYAVFQMLPIPPLNGTVIFFFSRMYYAIEAGLVLGFALLLSYVNIWAAILGAIIIAVLSWGIALKYD